MLPDEDDEEEGKRRKKEGVSWIIYYFLTSGFHRFIKLPGRFKLFVAMETRMVRVERAALSRR